MITKRSALYHHHRTVGAWFVEHHGWELPGRFAAPEAEAAQVLGGVGLADLSYRAKFETQSEPVQSWWRLGAGRYLVIGEPHSEPLAEARGSAGFVDVTSVYANLLLAGPRSKHVLGKLSSLNTSGESLPNLSCAQASVAHVHAIVLREDLMEVPAFHLLVTRDYAESVWEALAQAGEEFALRPFGLEALRLLRG